MAQYTILLVDEDQTHIAACTRHLSKYGLQVLTAHSVGQARSLAEMHKLDLAVIEIHSNGGAGATFAQELRSAPGSQIRVVITSRSHQLEQQIRKVARQLGVHGYIPKPFAPAALQAVIETELGEDLDSLDPRSRITPLDESFDLEGLKPLLRDVGAEIPPASALNQTVMPLVVRQLRESQATGLLYVRDGVYKFAICFQDGVPVYARTTCPALRLTTQLTVAEILHDYQLEHAAATTRSFGGYRWLDEMIVALGYVPAEEMRQAISRQISTVLKRLMSAGSAVSVFFRHPVAIPQECVAPTEVGPLIFEGLKSVKDLKTLAGHLPHLDSVPVRSSANLGKKERIQLSKFEEEFLGLIDGRKTFKEVCAIGRRTIGNIETLLLAFIDAGLVSLSNATTREEASRKAPALPLSDREPNDCGDLSDTCFPALLSTLHLSRKTGVLHVAHGGVQKSLHLQFGEIVYARSNQFEDRIGQVLVEANLVDEAAVERAATESGPSKEKRIGGVLMDRGLVTFEQLYWAGLFQVQKIVRSIMDWKDGAWSFEEGDLPTWISATPPLETASLLLEVIRSFPVERLEAAVRLGDEMIVQRRCGDDDALESVRLADLEEGILAWVEEPTSVSDVLNVGLAEEEEVRRAIHGLLAVGLLEWCSENEVPADPDSVPPELSSDSDRLSR